MIVFAVLITNSLSTNIFKTNNQELNLNNDISVYEQYVENFNVANNTQYSISPYTKHQKLIMQMSLDEFDDYLNSIANGSYYDVEIPNVKYDDNYLGCIIDESPKPIENYEDNLFYIRES